MNVKLIKIANIPRFAFETQTTLQNFLLDNNLIGLITPSGVENYLNEIEDQFEILKLIHRNITSTYEY
jgi:hypothetical protein